MPKLMLRIILAVLVLASVLALATPTWAQATDTTAADTAARSTQNRTGTDEFQQLTENITRWTRVLDRVREQLRVEGLPAAAFRHHRDTVSDVQSQISAARRPVTQRVDRYKKLIEALGPAPGEGEPAESSEIAAKREQLNKDLATVDGQLRQLDLQLEKSRLLLAAISDAQRVALENKLMVQTPSLFSAETWSKSAEELAALKKRAGATLSTWAKSPDVRKTARSWKFFAGVLAVALSALVGWALKLWLVRRFGRKRDIMEPTYRMRVASVLAEGTARTVIPIFVALVIYSALGAGGFLFGLSDEIVRGIVIAVVVFSVIYGLLRAMLSPALPQWRLAALGDYAAKLWYRYALATAAIVAIDSLLLTLAMELRPSHQLQTTYGFLIESAYGLIFFLIAIDKRLWRTPEEEMYVTVNAGKPAEAWPAAPAGRNKWWLVARTVFAVIALSIPVTALTGYGVLSDFISRRLLATAGIFLIGLVFHGLARDLLAIFTRESDKRTGYTEQSNPVYVWSVLFLDIALVLVLAFLIIPLWGVQWNNLFDWLGLSQSGFKIGDHVFTITDVVGGLVGFFIVILLVRSIQVFVNRRILQHTRVDSGVRDALTKAISYVGLVIAVIVAITIAGIDLSGLTIVAGALSVGVGFGLQSIVNNFVSGLILLAERPIKVGDWVQVGSYEGIVQRISVRSTEIKTFERASVILPNSDLISSAVINWVHQDKSGRVDLPVGVSYNSDPQEVERILLKCAEENAEILADPAPYVLFRDFGNDALMFELRGFVPEVNRRLRISSDLRFSIEKAFREAGIGIPFPQRDIHIKDADGLAGLLGKGNPARKKAAVKRPTAKRAQATTSRRRGGGSNVDPDET